MIRGLIISILFAFVVIINGQFPAVCNNNASINSKTCCPLNCGGIMKGNCTNITEKAIEDWSRSRPDVVNVMGNSPNLEGRGKADFRYRWPTVVFEKVCMCGGNYYGPDCSECKFGYMGADCRTRKPLLTRKTFSRLTQAERDKVVEAYSMLKHDYGKWSVVVDEPLNYNSGYVTLQNVSTYDMILYTHSIVGRDGVCKNGSDPTIDFAHEGPVFPVWHRHYLLFLERQMQRVLGNDTFALPYWSWDAGEMELFTEEHLGTPASVFNTSVDVTSTTFNSAVWPTVCDACYRNQSLSCADAWRVCDPEMDRAANRSLQRGRTVSASLKSYLPTTREVMIAITAPSYEDADQEGNYGVSSTVSSFRNRLEGFARICSASHCVGPRVESHVHNVVHLWIGGHMAFVPSAVNDPIFFLHHCNVDRVLESWIRRFVKNSTNPLLLPGYAPARGGHPGHNKVDWMVPFFPLVRSIDYYYPSDVFGYVYEELFESDIEDSSLGTCNQADSCASCTSSNGSCINCAGGTSEYCVVNPPTSPPTTMSATACPTSAAASSFGQIMLTLVFSFPLLLSLL